MYTLFSDKDLLKYLENQGGYNLNQKELDCKNITNNYNDIYNKYNDNINYNNTNQQKCDLNLTRDKIDNFKEGVSHIFNSYNNDLEVPKLGEVRSFFFLIF